jgi:hypothetical protein
MLPPGNQQHISPLCMNESRSSFVATVTTLKRKVVDSTIELFIHLPPFKSHSWLADSIMSSVLRIPWNVGVGGTGVAVGVGVKVGVGVGVLTGVGVVTDNETRP